MTIITTGIQNGPVVSRLEIRELFKDKDVFNLYLLAIERMQDIDQQDFGSWFQLAAIHGRPYLPYDNVGEKGNFGGYCAHSSILFPPWHRPYLALFEQTLAKHIGEIANEYPNAADKNKYKVAATRFRIPYWDWASQTVLPDIVATQETVEVYSPNGTRSIKNPLYSYKFNPVYSDFGDGLRDEAMWEAWPSTLRYPTSKDANGKTRPDQMQQVLRTNATSLRDRTYNMLTQRKSWFAFSNDGFNDNVDPVDYDSIEGIHGSIHGLGGGDGHFGVVDYAAFDPVFWMHHANVDRLFALWQALNPTTYVEPWPSLTGTFTTEPGAVEDADTPLTPFRATQYKFWDSKAVRDTRTFNYTYPELAKWSTLSAAEKRVRIHTEVNTLYGPQAPVNPVVAPVTPPVVPPVDPVKPSPFTISGTNLPSSHWHETATTADDKIHYHEWIANIVVEKYAVNTSFFVHIFLGDFNADSKKWLVDQNLVGSHAIFANNLTYTGCQRCRSAHEAGKRVTGTIPLTTGLGQRLAQQNISHLEPEQVIPYLQKNLHWRIQRHDGTPIERSDVPSLKVSVGHALVEIAQSGADFAVWGKVQTDLEVTRGRPGGASAA